MALTTQFGRGLDRLWERRTADLRALVIPRSGGQPLKFSRQDRERRINRLLDIATQVLIKSDGKTEFRDIIVERRLKALSGYGLLDRGKNLLRWAEENLSGPIVYGFWTGGRCLCIGKGRSWKRLRAYRHSAYLNATCIKVYRVRSKSLLGKAECLATHLYEPRYQQVKPARVKWGKACPICRKHDEIRFDLKTLFKMK